MSIVVIVVTAPVLALAAFGFALGVVLTPLALLERDEPPRWAKRFVTWDEAGPPVISHIVLFGMGLGAFAGLLVWTVVMVVGAPFTVVAGVLAELRR